MYVITNRIDVPADTTEAFEKVFVESMRSTLDGVPGLNRTTLMRPAADGLPYVSTMEFDSKDDFLADRHAPLGDDHRGGHGRGSRGRGNRRTGITGGRSRP